MTMPEERPSEGRGSLNGLSRYRGLAVLAGVLLSSAAVHFLTRFIGKRPQPTLPDPPPPPVPRRDVPLDRGSLLLTLLVALTGAAGFGWLEWQASHRLVLVPTQEIPAYTNLRPGDFPPAPAARFRFQRVSGPEYRASAHTAGELANHYTRAALPVGKPVARALLALATVPAETVVAAVPATEALLLGGTLRPGDRVDLLLTPSTPAAANAKRAAPAKHVAFFNLIVLDVRKGGESLAPPGIEAAATTRTGEAVLVLALPSGRSREFAALLPRSTLLLTRRR